jgi:predicted ester cyclase
MSSFDPEAFLRATLDGVWNSGLPGLLYGRAAAAVAIRGPSGQELLGRKEAVAEAVAWLAAFPAARLAVEDVIWSGDEQRGYLASVRYTCTGVNRSAGIYGQATGRPATWRGISHFLIYDSLIREVWQEWDELGLIQQLGLDRDETLARLAADRWPASTAEPFGLGEVRRGAGQLPPRSWSPSLGEPCDAASAVLQGLYDIWNRRLVGRIGQVYTAELAWQAGSSQPAGRDDLAAHALACLAALPDLSVHVDQLICRDDPAKARAVRVGLAWTALGTDVGPGVYRLPTGRRIRVPGLSQLRVVDGQIVAQWTAWSELGLRAQLARSPTAGVRSNEESTP